jgi:hypothetical protein
MSLLVSNSSKINYPQQPPINPFRTQHHPQRNSDDSVCIENPILRWCYVVGVMLLLLCLSVVGYKSYNIRFPSPNYTFTSGLSRLTGLRSSKASTTDIKILQPEILFEGKVPSIKNNMNNNLLIPRNTGRPNDSGSSSETSNQILPPVVLVQAPKIRSEVSGDVGYNRDDEIEDEEEVVGNGVQVDDNVESMLRPGEAHAKMLGATKDQFKLELNQEKYSDHAFGVEQDKVTSERSESQDQEDVGSDNIETDHVVVLFRKGDSTGNHPENFKADVHDNEGMDLANEGEALKLPDTSLHLEDTNNEEKNRINIDPVINDDTTRKRKRLRHILITTDS